MKNTAENPRIGLDNVVIAELLNDANGTTPPTYGEVIALNGAVTATANANSSVETDYADNGAFFAVDNRGNTELSLELTNVAPSTRAKMLGQKRQNGVTVETSQDQAPYFAMGFRVWIGGTDENGDKIYQYFWYAKGKFSVPENGGNTKGEGVEFQHVSMTAQFVSTLYSPDGKGGVFCAHCRTDYDTPAEIVQNWFNAPILGVNADLSELTATITQGSTKAKIKISGVKESGDDCSFSANSIILGNNLIVTKDGEMVAGTVTVDGDEIIFTAETTFATSDVVIVTITNGVKDISGVGVTPITSSVTIA